jgi:myo-inositol-1-phosphate synthase
MSNIKVVGPYAKHTKEEIISTYTSQTCDVVESNGIYTTSLKKNNYTFKTKLQAPKLGVMFVGLGGNNGTCFTAGILANKHNITWYDKRGKHSPNYLGSITQSSATKVGITKSSEIFVPLNQILPLATPNDIVISGWDISAMSLSDAMFRAEVLEYDLQSKLKDHMKDMVPLPGIYYEDFIAANQKDRADNILPGKDKQAHLDTIRENIRNFKKENNLDKVVIMWSGNTERYCKVTVGVHDTADNLLAGIKDSHAEISPSIVYAVASVLEGCSFINGSPQNTLVDGLIELATKAGVFVVGDDFKTGQTKLKTALVDMLVGAGLKPLSIVSYNHLGNNDGKNLSSESQFRSKQISKSSCVDDILASNPTLYKEGEHPDHEIIIKYVPSAGDSKKAIDEYVSEIFMGGRQTWSIYNVCEDSLLATPIILDLILLTELAERIEWKDEDDKEFHKFDVVLSLLGYLCKAPRTRDDVPIINSLYRQKNALENLFKICAGIPLEDNLLLDYRKPLY